MRVIYYLYIFQEGQWVLESKCASLAQANWKKSQYLETGIPEKNLEIREDDETD